MASYSLLVYAHILCMVFWLGTDVGVFIAGLRFIDPALSLEQRSAVINLGMIVDRFPRICFVAILPIGLQMAMMQGFISVPAAGMLLIWLLSLVWMTAVVMIMAAAGTPRARPWQRLERGFQLAGLCVFSCAGALGLIGRIPVSGWLSGKLLAYGAMCFFAIMLDRSFAPVMSTYGSIAAQGSTPERESELTRHMYRTYGWVIAIYAAVFVCGLLGTVKP